MRRAVASSGRLHAARRLAGFSALTLPVALVLGVGTASAENTAGPNTVQVMVDNAKVIRLPEKTQTVIVGNPAIADVTTIRNGVAVLTGKSFGVTNLIALDGSGGMLAESNISVEAAQQASIVVVQQGADIRNSYSCAPKCEPVARLGDGTKWYNDNTQQNDRYRSLAAGSASGTGMMSTVPSSIAQGQGAR